MKKLFYLFLLISLLFANEYNDDDLDGVPNYLDRCPHTPFSDIVDEYGCSIERLVKPRKYEFYFEYTYVKDKNIIDFKENDYLFSATFYKGNFDLSITGLYFNNRYKKGFSDTNIKFEYRFTPMPMWDLYAGLGIDLPIYNRSGNHFDYDIYLNNDYYYLGYKIFFGGYYTWTNDRFGAMKLDDAYGGYLGMESFFRHYTFDFAYIYAKSKFKTISNSIYAKIEKRFKKGNYIYMSYSHGINDDALDATLSIGVGQRY